MRKWIVITGGVLLVLVVLAGVVLVSLNTLINRNKQYILAQVKEAVGRDVTVGDIGVGLSGGIGVRLKELSVADDPSFSNEPFVRAEDLQVNMSLLPLLRKEFEINHVILHRPVINIIKDQRGRFNFSTLGGQKGDEKEKKEPEQDKPPRALLVSHIEVADGEIHYVDRTQGSDFRATNFQTSASFVNRTATIERLSAAAFDGSLTAKGSYDMRDQNLPRLAATTAVKAMDLTRLFREMLPSAPQNIRGLINMDLDVAGAGEDWSAIQKTLEGKGKAEVVDGALVDINLADSVLSGATGIPGVASLVPAEVRKKYPAIFESKDTEFKELRGSTIIGGGKAQTDDLVISAAEFEVQAKGWFAFDRSVDFHALLLLSEKLSQDIISRVSQAKNLADNEGRLEIPFTLSGKLPGAKPKPDIGHIAQAMGKGAIERGLERFLPKKSPEGRSEKAPAQEQRPSEPQKEKKLSPQEEILRGLQKSFRN